MTDAKAKPTEEEDDEPLTGREIAVVWTVFIVAAWVFATLGFWIFKAIDCEPHARYGPFVCTSLEEILDGQAAWLDRLRIFKAEP